jgi:hypothetical protein
MEFPLFIQIGISVVGLLLLYMIIRNLMQYFVDMGTKETTVSRRKRARLIRSLLLYPSLFGAAILMIQSIPFHLLTSFFIPILSPFALLLAYRSVLRREYPAEIMNSDLSALETVSKSWMIFLGLIILINQVLVITL